MSIQDTVDAIGTQLNKVAGEITGKISELEAQVAAGQNVDFSSLKATVDALDAIVPDVVEDPNVDTGDATAPGDGEG